MRKEKERCPKCGNMRKMTIHHVLPKRFFHGDGQKFKLCRVCHDELETHIPCEPPLHPSEYIRILTRFLRGGQYG